MGVERTPNKSQGRKITLQNESRAQRATSWAIPAPWGSTGKWELLWRRHALLSHAAENEWTFSCFDYSVVYALLILCTGIAYCLSSAAIIFHCSIWLTDPQHLSLLNSIGCQFFTILLSIWLACLAVAHLFPSSGVLVFISEGSNERFFSTDIAQIWIDCSSLLPSPPSPAPELQLSWKDSV